MSCLRNKKYIKVLVTARCSALEPFRSLQYCTPHSTVETDNVRVEYSPINSARLKYFSPVFTYAYTRDTEGKLYNFVRS